MDVVNGRYPLIYIDPPWQHRDKANAGKRGAVHKYSVMTVEEIARFPLTSLAAEDCLLACWWVGPMPEEALYCVRRWGFRLRTFLGFTWIKSTVNDRDHFGMGNWTRANQESVLFATRGSPRRRDAGVRQVVRAQKREHSRKPDEVRDRLVQLLGDVPRIELFARYEDPPVGWDVFGDEVQKTVDLVYERDGAPQFYRIKRPTRFARRG